MMAEDGEALDSWEEQEDSGVLDKRINAIKIMDSNQSRGQSSDIQIREDTGRTEYTPTVRILKRDPRSAEANARSNGSENKKPTKTLEQREAEYAEARKRIFGDAGTFDNAEQDEEASINTSAPRLVQKEQVVQAANETIRQPTGPDGTKGFKQVR